MEKPRLVGYSREDRARAEESIDNDAAHGDMEHYAAVLHIPVETFKDFERKRVLDLGAGKKLNFVRSLEAAGINADVTSASPGFAREDVLEGMANRKDSDKLVDDMGEHLRFADNSFDRVTCVSVFEFVESTKNYLRILKEVARVLAPGGIAYLGPIPAWYGIPGPQHIEEERLQKILGEDIGVEWNLQNQGYGESGMLILYTLIMRKKDNASD